MLEEPDPAAAHGPAPGATAPPGGGASGGRIGRPAGRRATGAAGAPARAEVVAAGAAVQQALAAADAGLARAATENAGGAARAVREAKTAAVAAALVTEAAARAAAADLAAAGREAAAAAVARARLEATAAALQEVARLKDEFLGTVAHELRTLLQVACGSAELLRAQLGGPGPGPTTGGLVEHILESTFRMASMLDDLLDFAAAGQGRLTVRPLDVDLTPVLRTVAFSLTDAADARRLALDLPPAAPAHADPARVAQVTTNLLTNALTYAPEGPVTLRAQRVKGGVRVAVLDRGPGIPPAERRRVWEKYYRGAAAHAGGAPGTGLGLAVVKALVEAHGGRVGLASAPGRGCRFWFELPAAAAGGV